MITHRKIMVHHLPYGITQCCLIECSPP